MINDEKVRVISLWEPWAMLWLLGFKCYETRPKFTSHTGTYLIHATKKAVEVDWEDRLLVNYQARERILKSLGYGSFKDFPTGCIIGAVDMVGCYKIHNDGSLPYFNHPHMRKQYIGETEQVVGDWSDGRWAWECKNRRVLETPLPYKGSQGYYATFKGDFDQLKFIDKNKIGA